MSKISQDYLDLKRSIADYIPRYPKANKEENNKRLELVCKLREKTNKTPEEEQEYYKIRNEIAISNGGFAMMYVMKYSSILNDDASIPELFQEATIGIIETIDKFDITKNTAFTTYAYHHVKKRIIDYIKKNKLVKAPREIARNIKHVSEIQEKLIKKLGKDPSTKEIQELLLKERNIEIKEEVVNDILILSELNSAGYDDSFISEYSDQVSYDEEKSELFKTIELSLLSQIQNLPEKTQKIIKLRFGLGEPYPHSIEEITHMLDLSNEEVEELTKEDNEDNCLD